MAEETDEQRLESCVFCRRTGLPKSEMSDEHVFLYSLKNLATPGARTRIRFVREDPETGELRTDVTPSGHPYAVTVRICANCNTRILNNRIEQPIRKRLRSMTKGEAVHLNSGDMLNFARWCAKTAMTRELIDIQDGRGPHSIPEEQYALLHDWLIPPFSMMMFFGKAEYTPDTWHRHRRFKFPLNDSGDMGSGHFTTLVIGHLWIVVVGFSHSGHDFWIDALGHCTMGTSNVLHNFWPPREDEIPDLNVPIASAKFRLDSRNFPPRNHYGMPPATEYQYKDISYGPRRWEDVTDNPPPGPLS